MQGDRGKRGELYDVRRGRQRLGYLREVQGVGPVIRPVQVPPIEEDDVYRATRAEVERKRGERR